MRTAGKKRGYWNPGLGIQKHFPAHHNSYLTFEVQVKGHLFWEVLRDPISKFIIIFLDLHRIYLSFILVIGEHRTFKLESPCGIDYICESNQFHKHLLSLHCASEKTHMISALRILSLAGKLTSHVAKSFGRL